MEDRVKSGIYGLAIGDALGVPVEFVDREILAKDPVTDMRGFGTHKQPAGTWSDDTSMALATLVGLSSAHPTPNSIAKEYLRWYQNKAYTPDGHMFDIGVTVGEALDRILWGIVKNASMAGSDSEYGNRNGSLMRILPAAFFLRNEKDVWTKAVTVYPISAITHRHMRSIVACHMYVELAIALMCQDPLTAYKETVKLCNDYYKDTLEPGVFDRFLSGALQDAKRDKIRSSGYVIDTLEAAVWSLLTTDNYKDAVLTAVNLGGDTDTTGSVAGGLAGLYYGYDSIPKEWFDTLRGKKQIDEAIQRYTAKYPD